MHQKYGMSRIVRKLYSVESNYCTYLAVHGDCGINRQNSETYDLQFTNCKRTKMIKITTGRMIMNCSILICTNQNYCVIINIKNMTYRFFDDYFSTTKSVTSK